MSDLDELADAGQSAPVDLRTLAAVAMKQLELESLVAKHEAALKSAKDKLRKIQEGELPDALKAAGVPSFTLDNGMTVSYSEDMKVSVPKARKDAIIKKMKEWGYGPNVSNTLTIDLGKGDNNTAAVLIAEAEKVGVTATLAEDVPTGTVKKALNARIKEGKSDDLAFFGAFAFTKATVK